MLKLSKALKLLYFNKFNWKNDLYINFAKNIVKKATVATSGFLPCYK